MKNLKKYKFNNQNHKTFVLKQKTTKTKMKT